jgi:hypothetical protein
LIVPKFQPHIRILVSYRMSIEVFNFAQMKNIGIWEKISNKNNNEKNNKTFINQNVIKYDSFQNLLIR